MGYLIRGKYFDYWTKDKRQKTKDKGQRTNVNSHPKAISWAFDI